MSFRTNVKTIECTNENSGSFTLFLSVSSCVTISRTIFSHFYLFKFDGEIKTPENNFVPDKNGFHSTDSRQSVVLSVQFYCNWLQFQTLHEKFHSFLC